MSDDLAAFLLARIDEDEATARAAQAGPWTVTKHEYIGEAIVEAIRPNENHTVTNSGSDGDGGCDLPDAEHIARWDPARVLLECDAKRELLAFADPYAYADDGGSGMSAYADYVQGFLALPYADHPDYRNEWRP